MSEPPERPAQPGTETHVPKEFVADLQAALDATYNQARGAAPDRVAEQLWEELDRHGVADVVSERWVLGAAGDIADGEPVAAEPDDA